MNALVKKRRAARVIFSQKIHVRIVAIDGTWSRPCVMKDASETGIGLVMLSSIEGLNLREFFLLLSSVGLAYRRCELAWVNGKQVGARFV